MITILVVVVAAAVWLVALRPGGTSGAAQYRTETVSAGTLKSTVSASGTLEPAQQSELSFGSSGTVTAVDVTVGEAVRKGQVLASIDPSALQVALQSAQADLTAAQDTLTDLQEADDSSSAAIAAAKATVTVKENAVTQAQTNLDGANLTAPFAGIVAAVNVTKGDSTGNGSSGATSTGDGSGSAAGSGGSGASEGSGSGASGKSTTSTASTGSSSAITVISKGQYTVSTSVSASDVGSIKQGMQATITGTGADGSIFGTVSSVGVVATSSDGSSGGSTFPVTVKVTGTHTDLLPGSSVTVAITTKQLANAISVSTDAITTDNGATYVQRLVNGKEVQTKVGLGAVVGRDTVITSGLSSGDQVVIPSFRAGQASGTTSRGAGSGGAQERGFGEGAAGGGFGGGGFGGGTGGYSGTGRTGGR